MARPVKVKIYYRIAEKIFERGDYMVDGEKIRGHRDYHYSSAVWLSWNLPKSKEHLLKAVKRWRWQTADITYDNSKVDLDKRRQFSCSDYKDNDETLVAYDKFNGEDDTIVTRVENETGPEQIIIYYDDGNQQEVRVTNSKDTYKRLKRLLN